MTFNEPTYENNSYLKKLHLSEFAPLANIESSSKGRNFLARSHNRAQHLTQGLKSFASTASSSQLCGQTQEPVVAGEQDDLFLTEKSISASQTLDISEQNLSYLCALKYAKDHP